MFSSTKIVNRKVTTGINEMGGSGGGGARTVENRRVFSSVKHGGGGGGGGSRISAISPNDFTKTKAEDFLKSVLPHR